MIFLNSFFFLFFIFFFFFLFEFKLFFEDAEWICRIEMLKSFIKTNDVKIYFRFGLANACSAGEEWHCWVNQTMRSIIVKFDTFSEFLKFSWRRTYSGSTNSTMEQIRSKISRINIIWFKNFVIKMGQCCSDRNLVVWWYQGAFIMLLHKYWELLS